MRFRTFWLSLILVVAVEANTASLLQLNYNNDPSLMQNSISEAFERIDANKDAQISRDEFLHVVLTSSERNTTTTNDDDQFTTNPLQWLEISVKNVMAKVQLRRHRSMTDFLWQAFANNNTYRQPAIMDKTMFMDRVSSIMRQSFHFDESICNRVQERIESCSRENPLIASHLFALGQTIVAVQMQCQRGLSHLARLPVEQCVLQSSSCAQVPECFSPAQLKPMAAALINQLGTWLLLDDIERQIQQYPTASRTIMVLYYPDSDDFHRDAERLFKRHFELEAVNTERRPAWTFLFASSPPQDFANRTSADFDQHYLQLAQQPVPVDTDRCRQVYSALLEHQVVPEEGEDQNEAAQDLKAIYFAFQHCIQGYATIEQYQTEDCISMNMTAADGCFNKQHDHPHASLQHLQKRNPLIAIYPTLVMWSILGFFALILLSIPYFMLLGNRQKSEQNEIMVSSVNVLSRKCPQVQMYWGSCGAPTSVQSRSCPQGGRPWLNDTCSGWLRFTPGSRLCNVKHVSTLPDYGNFSRKYDGRETVKGWNRFLYFAFGMGTYQCQSLCVKDEC